MAADTLARELATALRRARSRMMQLPLTPEIERELDEMATLLINANGGRNG